MQLSPAEKEIKAVLEALHQTAEFSLSNVPRCYVHCENIGNENVRLTAASPRIVLSVVVLKEYLYCYVRNYFEYDLPDIEQFAFLPDLKRITKETPFFLNAEKYNMINWKACIPDVFTNARDKRPFISEFILTKAARIWKKAAGTYLGIPDLWVDHRSLVFWVNEANFIGVDPMSEDETVFDNESYLIDLVGENIFQNDVLYNEIHIDDSEESEESEELE